MVRYTTAVGPIQVKGRGLVHVPTAPSGSRPGESFALALMWAVEGEPQELRFDLARAWIPPWLRAFRKDHATKMKVRGKTMRLGGVTDYPKKR